MELIEVNSSFKLFFDRNSLSGMIDQHEYNITVHFYY